MYTANLGAAQFVYSSSAECLARFKAGEFGATSSSVAKLAYQNCLRTTPRTLNTALTPAQVAGRQATIPSAPAATGGYVPDCAGTYNPCNEVSKSASQGVAVSSSLKAKCDAFRAACQSGSEGTGDRYQTEESDSGTYIDPVTGQTIDSTTGLPVEPWYMNKTYWLIGGAVLVGGWLLLR